MCVLLHPHFDQRVGAKLKNDRDLAQLVAHTSGGDLAQLVAHTSGGREVAGSSPVIPTKTKVKVLIFQHLNLFLCPNNYDSILHLLWHHLSIIRRREVGLSKDGQSLIYDFVVIS